VPDIKVTFVGLIHRLVRSREEFVTLPRGTTLGELLQELIARFGLELKEYLLQDGELAPFATILIDGRNALSQGGLGAKLSDDSQSHVEIVVLGPPLMGG
jgi:molybdopterin converting factor small subunit